MLWRLRKQQSFLQALRHCPSSACRPLAALIGSTHPYTIPRRVCFAQHNHAVVGECENMSIGFGFPAWYGCVAKWHCKFDYQFEVIISEAQLSVCIAAVVAVRLWLRMYRCKGVRNAGRNVISALWTDVANSKHCGENIVVRQINLCNGTNHSVWLRFGYRKISIASNPNQLT